MKECKLDKSVLYQAIDPTLLDAQPDEWGVVDHCPNPGSIGYATTLTSAIIRQAVDKNLDLLVTHHDAWEFMLAERAESHNLLTRHKISHIWCHEPLDKAPFGTAAVLLEIIGCIEIGKIVEDCGRVGELQGEHKLADIINLLDAHLSEKPCRIHDSGKLISRIGCVPGGGMLVDYLVEALEYDVDLFITGETSLYLLEYARYREVSTLIYSHNYTEIFGTHNLARRIADHLGIAEITRLDEPHF